MLVSLKIEKPIGLAFWLFLSGYSEFLNVNDMTVVYPNGIIDIIPWENGNVDKKNIQRFLPALLKDGESETISLKPGESIVGHYSASKKTLSSNLILLALS